MLVLITTVDWKVNNVELGYHDFCDVLHTGGVLANTPVGKQFGKTQFGSFLPSPTDLVSSYCYCKVE